MPIILQSTLTILIAGHRPDLMAQESIDAIEQSMGRILSVFLNYLEAPSASSNKAVNSSIGRLRVITGNSSGVDEIAVQVAAKLGIQTQILGFESSESTEEADFTGSAETVLLPTLAGASQILQNEMVSARDVIALCYSDFLIAVWDGKEPHGFAGGTVRLIRNAAIHARPAFILWVDGTIRRLPSLVLDDATRRSLSYMDADPAALERLLVPYDENETKAELGVILTGNQPRTNHIQTPIGISGDAGLAAFKKTRLWSPGLFHEMLTAFAAMDKTAAVKAWAKDRSREYYGVSIRELPEKMWQSHPIAEPERLQSKFKAHDVAANHYAGKHRDISWIVFGLSALAVFAAVAGGISLGGPFSASFWAVLELCTLVGIVSIYALARRGAWHEQWLEHRYQAELIRYARMCMPILTPPDVLTEDCFKVGKTALGAISYSAHAEVWAIRRLIIDEGLPTRRDGGVYRVSIHLNECIDYVAHILADQIQYHNKKSVDSHHVSHALHRLTHLCFLATGMAIVGHFFLHSSLWLLLTAALPAFAAAVHGVSIQNEFERLGAISLATSSKLSALAVTLKVYRDQSSTRSWLVLQKITLDAARAMSDSNRQWQEIVVRKATTLPC